MKDFISDIISKTNTIVVLLPMLAAVFIVYLSSMENRREKIYLDFFLVEKIGREDLKKTVSLGYIIAGLSVISVASLFIWLRYSGLHGAIRVLIYVICYLGMCLYCWFVYNNAKPEKYEIRKWASYNKKAQKTMCFYRSIERGIFFTGFVLCIECVPLKAIIISLLLFLLVDYIIEILIDTICIKKVLQECITDMICIVDDNNSYAIIIANSTYFYCLEVEKSDMSILKVYLDRIRCFPHGEKYIMERVRFDHLVREGAIC